MPRETPPSTTISTIVSSPQVIGGGSQDGATHESGKKIKRPAHELLTIAKAVNPENGSTNCTYIVEALIARLTSTNPETVAPDLPVRSFEETKKALGIDFKFDTDFYEAFNTMRNTPEGTIGVITIVSKIPKMSHIVTIVNHKDGPAIIEAQNLGPYKPVEIITEPRRAIGRYCDYG